MVKTRNNTRKRKKNFIVSDNFIEYEDSDPESESESESDSEEFIPDIQINIKENENVPLIVKNWIKYQMDNNSHDDKMKYKVHFVLSYPWRELKNIPISLESTVTEKNEFWNNTFNIINENVSFMDETVSELINMVTRTIVNPSGKRKPILITGKPGVGKTRLLTKVFGPVLGVPVEYINVSGYTREDLTSLKGSSGVWQGSGASSIIQAIHKAKCKNIIIVFDEFDKIFDIQIYHFFNQLFDDSSTFFMDQFIEGLPFDISQITFVCLTNSNEMIPEPLMSRFKKKIYIESPDNEKKISICQKHSIPEILSVFKLNAGTNRIEFPDETLRYLINMTNIKNDSGMRELVNIVESIVEKINTVRVLGQNGINSVCVFETIKFPLVITKEIIDRLVC